MLLLCLVSAIYHDIVRILSNIPSFSSFFEDFVNCLLLWPLCVLCVIYTCRDCGQQNCSVRMRANRHAHFPQSLVYVWKNRASRPPTSYSTSPPTLQSSDSIRIATWNCRGLHNSIPYIRHLIAKGIDILVLQEHWLWPFE